MATSLGEAEPRTPLPTRERFWNLPNTITVVRTAVVPVLIGFPLYAGPVGSQVVAWLFILSALGDVLDGWAARRGRQVTRIGKLLDPLADKLTVSTALIVLLVMGRIPAWALGLVVVVIGRELAVTGLRGIASAGATSSRRPGKASSRRWPRTSRSAACCFPRGPSACPIMDWG